MNCFPVSLLLSLCNVYYVGGLTGDACSSPKNVRILCIGTSSQTETFAMRYIRPAVDFAIKKVQDQLGLTICVKFVRDGSSISDPKIHCDALDVSNLLGLTALEIPKFNPHMVIGPSCNSDMKAIAQLSIANMVTTFSPLAPNIADILDLSNVLNRVGFSMKLSVMPILQYCIQHNLKDLTVIWYQGNPLDPVDAVNYIPQILMQSIEELQDVRGPSNLDVASLNILQIIHNPLDKTSLDATLNLATAKNQSRAILISMPSVELLKYFLAAYRLKMTDGSFAFFVPDFYFNILNDPTLGGIVAATDFPVVQQVLSMVLFATVEMYLEDQKRIDFRAAMQKYISTSSNPEYVAPTTILTMENYLHMANSHDIVMIFIGALLKMPADIRDKWISEASENLHLTDAASQPAGYSPSAARTKKNANIDLLFRYFGNQTISNPTYLIASDGSYFINVVGDKLENYYLRSKAEKGVANITTPLTIADYPRVFVFDTRTNIATTLIEIKWPNDVGPNGAPACGFKGDEGPCKPDPWRVLIAWIVGVPLVAFTFGMAVWSIRRYQEQVRIHAECIANPKDLLVINPDEEYRVRKEKLNQVKNATRELEKDPLGGNLNNSMGSSGMGLESSMGGNSLNQSLNHSITSAGSHGMSQFRRRDDTRSDTGFWRNTIVTVRWTHKKWVYLSPKAIWEIREIRRMIHDNLAVCIGACVAKDMALVIYEYCPRGTIQELIENIEQKFDWTMRIAFLEDIVNGLLFLQNSALNCHGRLTSDCCHIDGRFVVRLSDYGLPTFFSHNKLENWVAMRSTKFAEGQLWQAPELLRLADDEAIKHTGELDVYSLGIILQEVILRSYPYAMYQNTLGYDMVCTYLRVGKLIDDKPLRPTFSPEVTGIADQGLIDLAVACWAEDPKDRPKLAHVREQLKESAANMGITDAGSVMDMLMDQMNRQNSRLQAIVEEQGRHILNEKLQADRVIDACFPKEIAHKLKHDQLVSPEAMEIVSLLYIQIVNFEHILTDSTPVQLLDLLNVYNSFIDRAVTKFDCHKMDMEMDMTMVASGVPKRNGILNAREICRLALTIHYRVRELRFHHRPNDPVKIQTGIHSGSCVAAVVGKLIPRYMLFGDTIEVTKRMLTTGTAQKIQISSYTKDLLETFGSFRTEERGEVFVRGKGAMTTYWLTGEDGNRELKKLQTKYEANLFTEDRDDH